VHRLCNAVVDRRERCMIRVSAVQRACAYCAKCLREGQAVCRRKDVSVCTGSRLTCLDSLADRCTVDEKGIVKMIDFMKLENGTSCEPGNLYEPSSTVSGGESEVNGRRLATCRTRRSNDGRVKGLRTVSTFTCQARTASFHTHSSFLTPAR